MRKTLIKRAVVALLFLLCHVKPLLTANAESIEEDLERRLAALQDQLKMQTNLAARLVALETDMERLSERQRALAKRAIPGALIPVGAMIPYFGKRLPEGFVWADGCPDSADGDRGECDWPDELYGEGVPSMADMLLGGTDTPEEVGSVWNSGKVQTPQYVVDGNSFRLPDVRNQDGSIKPPPDSWFLMFEKRGNTKKVSDAQFHDKLKSFTRDIKGRNSTEVRMKLVEAQGKYDRTTYPETKMQGGKTLPKQDLRFDTAASNPRHVRCRWIIRIK